MSDADKEVIQVYADAALKRRVEEAAAKHNVPVNEYWLDAVEQKLADEATTVGEVVEEVVGKNEEHHPRKQQDETLWEEIRELRERILVRRGGKPIDIDVLEQLRSERDDELTGLR